jgi:biotin--protein ligase
LDSESVGRVKRNVGAIACIFSDATVRLGNDNGDEATITGLDDYGFLLVRLQKDGSTKSVQPDGNSFDMMRNLIVPKNN